MNELHTADASEATAGDPGRGVPIGVNPAAGDAITAYLTELDELLAHLAAHPADRWVAYYYSRRIGFGSDRREFERECLAKFPDGLFRVFMIDGADKCPEDTVV